MLATFIYQMTNSCDGISQNSNFRFLADQPSHIKIDLETIIGLY